MKPKDTSINIVDVYYYENKDGKLDIWKLITKYHGPNIMLQLKYSPLSSVGT